MSFPARWFTTFSGVVAAFAVALFGAGHTVPQALTSWTSVVIDAGVEQAATPAYARLTTRAAPLMARSGGRERVTISAFVPSSVAPLRLTQAGADSASVLEATVRPQLQFRRYDPTGPPVSLQT